MKKQLLFLFICSLVLLHLVGCTPETPNEETTPDTTTDATTESTTPAPVPNETTTPPEETTAEPPTPETPPAEIELKPAPITPTPTGVLDKSSELIVKLGTYLKQLSLVSTGQPALTFSEKIDLIQNGAQPIHVAFDSNNSYFVCAYFHSTHANETSLYCCTNEYTWVGYQSEKEILEYFNDLQCIVVFQINKALTVTNILDTAASTPNIEHFQIYKPTFENGVNIGTRVVFNKTFIYLNKSTSDILYCSTSSRNHNNSTIPCIHHNKKHYLSFYLYTIYTNGEHGNEEDYTYSFGEYYKDLMALMKKIEFNSLEETNCYGILSLEDFVNQIIK